MVGEIERGRRREGRRGEEEKGGRGFQLVRFHIFWSKKMAEKGIMS